MDPGFRQDDLGRCVLIQQERRVVSSILRWSARFLLILLILIAAIVAGFRLAASLRETEDRNSLAPASGHLVETPRGRMFVQEKGPADGAAVVLFHGTAAWSELWRRSIDALAADGYHVVALDLPPFGFSDPLPSYTRTAVATEVNEVLDALKIDSAIIVGHSFGAGAASEFALRFPARTRRLVLVDAALSLTQPPSDTPSLLEPAFVREILVSLTVTNPLATKFLLQSLIEKKERALPEYVEILQRPLRRRGETANIANWLYFFLGPDRTAKSADRSAYAQLRCPTVLIWGEKDTVTPIEQARDLQKLVPQATLAVLPRLGHIPQIEDPDAFNAVLLQALGPH
jgi:pimeloyl-ACP methyl ester carboxylesterase